MCGCAGAKPKSSGGWFGDDDDNLAFFTHADDMNDGKGEKNIKKDEKNMNKNANLNILIKRVCL